MVLVVGASCSEDYPSKLCCALQLLPAAGGGERHHYTPILQRRSTIRITCDTYFLLLQTAPLVVVEPVTFLTPLTDFVIKPRVVIYTLTKAFAVAYTEARITLDTIIGSATLVPLLSVLE